MKILYATRAVFGPCEIRHRDGTTTTRLCWHNDYKVIHDSFASPTPLSLNGECGSRGTASPTTPPGRVTRPCVTAFPATTPHSLDRECSLLSEIREERAAIRQTESYRKARRRILRELRARKDADAIARANAFFRRTDELPAIIREMSATYNTQSDMR